MTKIARLSFALLVLFVLSGFAGLIYQSVWSHYLGLTLGHAAYAQSLVLAIYMGGMALGAWLASRYSLRWRNLILGYALVEGVIGLLGLVFHPLFVAYTGLSQDSILPMLSSAGTAHAWQWLSAALLIAPQSVLLGATFPLMSAGLVRALPGRHGEVLGGLYFSNSLGAALGALVATFALLPAVGLPGTVMAAGLLNLLVALGAWAVSKQLGADDTAPVPSTPEATAGAAEAGSLQRLGRIMLLSTAISGAASFVYEIGWVRLLNQALGTTVHSFELMLAAFILGLAFGGLWIRRRAHAIAEPVRYVGYVQVWMGVAALLSVPVFTQSFTWVGWMMDALSRSEGGYTLFELGTAAIALLVMFPAAFLAGMTLPLFTLALLRAGAGERAIGRIYAANTLGAIVGVVLAMHVLIPLIGVRLAVTLAALVDGLVGLYLLRMVNPARMTPRVAGVGLAMVAAVAFSIVLGKPDPLQQASGVYRTGKARLANSHIDYLRDGKTATVAIINEGEQKAISTNGKPDAALSTLRDAPTPDEVTMIMAGLLPLAKHPSPRRIAVIGWGSGLTTHTLLGSDLPEQVDTIEIERVMVDAARLFGERVQRAYSDPRSHLQIDDARTFFSTGGRKYDAIVSEPSNPWVSGVAGLFTQEFYGFARHHLDTDGVLVQWIHTYEIDDALVATMMAALADQFPHIELYVTNSADLLVVASQNPIRVADFGAVPPGSVLASELRRVGVDRPEELALRRIGGTAILRNFIRTVGARPHSDYYPTVSLNAPRARFMRRNAPMLTDLVTNGMPVLDVLDCRVPLGRSANLPYNEDSTFSQWQQTALAIADTAREGRVTQALAKISPESIYPVQAALGLSQRLADSPHLLAPWTDSVALLARGTIGHLPAEDLRDLWMEPTWLPAEVQATPEVQAVLAAYSAAARRAPGEMRTAAGRALELPDGVLAPRMREQMLVIAMLGALGSGDAADVAKLEARWDRTITSGELASTRSYLLAWADGPVPACMARMATAAAGGGPESP